MTSDVSSLISLRSVLRLDGIMVAISSGCSSLGQISDGGHPYAVMSSYVTDRVRQHDYGPTLRQAASPHHESGGRLTRGDRAGAGAGAEAVAGAGAAVDAAGAAAGAAGSNDGLLACPLASSV